MTDREVPIAESDTDVTETTSECTSVDTPADATNSIVNSSVDAAPVPPVAPPSIEEMRAALAEKYSEAEIEQYLKMGRRLACKPVLTELMNVIKAAPKFGEKKSGKRLVRDIDATMEFRECAHLKIPMRDEHGPIFRSGVDMNPHESIDIGLSLSITGRNEMPSFDCPEFIANAVLEQFRNMIQTAMAFWLQWAQDHKALFARICDFRPDVDFSALHTDVDRPVMLHFDPASDTRVCVFAYYYNSKTNQIMVKNPGLRGDVAAHVGA